MFTLKQTGNGKSQLVPLCLDTQGLT